MQQPFEEFIVQRIGEKNPLHSKKIRKNLKRMHGDPLFAERAQQFYDKYDAYLQKTGKDRAHAVDSYLRMIDDFIAETVRFNETGKYTSSSFAEVNARVYARPEIMEYYMHGLLLTQFIWVHHFELLKFYSAYLSNIPTGQFRYFEIGGGHGLYVTLAREVLGDNWEYTVADISETSLAVARNFIGDDKVKFLHTDVFELDDSVRAEFVVMGEVLEHVEDPLALLLKLKAMLAAGGTLFITTPTNAPAIDHIYLFRNTDEIRALIAKAGLKVEAEKCFSSEDCSVEMAEANNISVLYTAFLSKP